MTSWRVTGLGPTSEPKTKAERVHSIATLATLTSPRYNTFVASLRHVSLLAVLLSACSSPTLAFAPVPVRKSFGTSAVSNGIRICTHHGPPCLFASEDENEDGSSGSKVDEDDEEDDEVDIITQKLRRNAEKRGINPIKEHDKMIEENEAEANMGVNGSKNRTMGAASALYSYMLAEAVDPNFDPDVSSDEAYVETQFKELLSRSGEKLSRLGPGIATLPLDPSSNEAESENELARMESELKQVIDEAQASSKQEWDEGNLEESSKNQSEILEKAHKLQTEIDQLHVDDCGAVLLANLGFYEAFSLQDPEGMKDVWWKSPSVMCVHPSHTPLIGSNAVFESFATMFLNGMKGRVTYLTPTNIRGLSVRGSTASLVCDEEVYSKGTLGESMGRIGGELVNKLLTTNVFRKVGGQWKMVHRHASWHPETTAAQEAMKAKPGIVLYDEKDDALGGTSESMSNRLRKAKGMALRKLNGDGTSKRPSGLPSIPSSLDGLDANAVLGIPTPKEDVSEKSKGSSDSGDGMIGKIINLSDLLGGGSDSGTNKDDDSGIGDALADLLGGSADSDTSSTSGSGTPEDPFITRRIIKVGPEGIENLGKKNSKISSDKEEEEETVIDLRGKTDEEQKAEMAQLMGKMFNDGDGEALKNASVSDDTTQEKESQESIRQKCITTLRKLSDDGQLSPNQKRVLLTDIITSSAKKEMSMVEVAFELLCTGSEGTSDLDTGMEDFTEQCRVFATMGEE